MVACARCVALWFAHARRLRRVFWVSANRLGSEGNTVVCGCRAPTWENGRTVSTFLLLFSFVFLFSVPSPHTLLIMLTVFYPYFILLLSCFFRLGSMDVPFLLPLNFRLLPLFPLLLYFQPHVSRSPAITQPDYILFPIKMLLDSGDVFTPTRSMTPHLTQPPHPHFHPRPPHSFLIVP